MKRVLVAGIGNIFLGDDAFGCEVVRLLEQSSLPEGVTVTDFGIRGYDLAYAMLDGYDQVIIVDVVPRGREPGTLFLIEPILSAYGQPGQPIGMGHDKDPVSVLQMVRTFGGTTASIQLVGCEPASYFVDEGDIALSDPVKAAVPQAVEMIQSLIAQPLDGNAADRQFTAREVKSSE